MKGNSQTGATLYLTVSDCESGNTRLCSACKETHTMHGKANYCPKCGAKVGDCRKEFQKPKKLNKIKRRDCYRGSSLYRESGIRLYRLHQEWNDGECEQDYEIYASDIKQLARCLAVHRRLRLTSYLSEWDELNGLDLSIPRAQLREQLREHLSNRLFEEVEYAGDFDNDLNLENVTWSIRKVDQ